MQPITLLISCMHQHDTSILERSNVQSDCVVVNQCDCEKVETFTFINKFGEEKKCTFVSTRQRGLSKSRNMAISYAPAHSVCLLCDDDETLADDIEQKIDAGYRRMPDADLIAFSLVRKDLASGKIYPTGDCVLKFQQILKTSSLQITFRKDRIEDFGVRFDEKMGSGTGNGGGEENKFMLDVWRAGGKLRYAPECVATVNPGESQWFKGYTSRYMQNLGWASKRSMGRALGLAYIHQWVLTHKPLYGKDISLFAAYVNLLKGFFSRR